MFTFNGTHISALGINVNYPTIQAMPEFENYFQNVDGKDGLIDFGMNFKEKIFGFNCNFVPQTSYSSALAIVDNLNNFLNPKIGLKTFIFDSLPNRYLEVRLYQGIDINKINLTGGEFELIFIAPDPIFKSTSEISIEYTTTGYKEFSINGNHDTYPIITLIADIQQGSEPILINFNNKDVIEVQPTQTTSYKLVIDCENRTVNYINIATEDEENGLDRLSKIAFPILNTGDNTVEITESGTYTTLSSLEIEYVPRYI